VPMKNPIHPGQIVRHGCLEALGLSVTAGAKLLVGLPASTKASTGGDDGTKYFLSPSELTSLVDSFTTHTGFAGVMPWDAGNSDSDTNQGSQ